MSIRGVGPIQRLLAIIHTPVYGGPHNQMAQLAKPLRDAGWETIVILPQESGDGAGRLRDKGVRVLQLPITRLRARWNVRIQVEYLRTFPRDVALIQEVIRQEGIDLVQVCGLMNIQGAMAADRERRPVVWQLLSDFAPAALRALLMPYAVRHSDVLMSTGRAIAALHPGASRLGNRLVLFAPPVDTASLVPDDEVRQTMRRRLSLPDDAVVVGTLGNRNKMKRHELLIQAVALARQSNPNLYLVIVGSVNPTHLKYYRKKVMGEAARHRLLGTPFLRFEEPAGSSLEYLHALDIFALTSRSEGMPTALLEAMSCQLPCVCVDVGSAGEVVDDEVGELIRDPNPEHFSEALLKLASSKDLRDSLGLAARERAVQQFDVSSCLLVHLNAYEMARDNFSNRRR